MLLRRLKEYADERMDLPPALYSETAVRYIIDLDASGRLLSPQPTDTADPANPRTKRGRRFLMPQVGRTSGVKPLLLTDKPEYVLGLAKEGAKAERVQASHQAYHELLERCAAVTNEPAIQAVLTFLGDAPLTKLQLPSDFDYGGIVTFRVDGLFPTELPNVRAFWAAEHDPAAQQATVMQCIVCGQERPVLETLQAKLKGIPGGQTSGTALISANAKAFESYGLEGSLIAPTCADCGERFTRALNELLSGAHSRIIIGDTAFVFWTREKVEFDLWGALNEPSAQQVQDMVRSLFTAVYNPRVDEVAFYAVTLSASGGRAVVRDWIDTTVGAVKENLGRWFARQQIVDEYGKSADPFSVYWLARATVREAKDLPVTTPRALLRAALTNTPLPMGLLYQAVRRSRAERNVTHQRAALIKLVLASQAPYTQEDRMTTLDLHSPDPAYRYGRLLAVLAEVQRNAIGKAALVDRFYGTASSAPAAVFGRLLRGAQPHLSKLERDRPGVAFALERRIEEVMSGIDGFLPILTLEQQGRFALGFYHQRAHDRAQMQAAAERKKAQPGPAAADPVDPADPDTTDLFAA